MPQRPAFRELSTMPRVIRAARFFWKIPRYTTSQIRADMRFPLLPIDGGRLVRPYTMPGNGCQCHWPNGLRASVGRGRAAILGMHPVRRDDCQRFVDLEDTARPRVEVGDLLVGLDQMQVDGAAFPDERIEPDVRRSVRAHRDEPAELLAVHEPIELGVGNVTVVAVENHRDASTIRQK